LEVFNDSIGNYAHIGLINEVGFELKWGYKVLRAGDMSVLKGIRESAKEIITQWYKVR
jgi:hypothetical protein